MYRENDLGLTVKLMNGLIRDYVCTEIDGENRGRPDRNKNRMMWGWVVDYLYYHKDEVVHQKEVETSFRVPKSTIATILKKMEQDGVIVRVPEENDTRLKRVMLSEKGIAQHERVLEQFDRLEKEMCRDISEDDLKVFFKVSDQIIENLEELKEGKVKEHECN